MYGKTEKDYATPSLDRFLQPLCAVEEIARLNEVIWAVREALTHDLGARRVTYIHELTLTKEHFRPDGTLMTIGYKGSAQNIR